MPTSPGKLVTVPATTHRVSPSDMVSPILASSEVRNEGSTSAMCSLASLGQVLAGSVWAWP